MNIMGIIIGGKNGKIVSAIRNRIAGVLNIKELQKVLYE